MQLYQEVMRPLDSWHLAVMNAHRDDSYLAPMTFSRGRRARPFSKEDLKALRGFAPHLNRALRVTLRRGQWRSPKPAIGR
jgi:hypothetical protein